MNTSQWRLSRIYCARFESFLQAHRSTRELTKAKVAEIRFISLRTSPLSPWKALGTHCAQEVCVWGGGEGRRNVLLQCLAIQHDTAITLKVPRSSTCTIKIIKLFSIYFIYFTVRYIIRFILPHQTTMFIWC